MVKILLRILFGLIFIASAILKVFPIEPFENLLTQYYLSSFLTAPFIARAFVSLELLIGFYIILSPQIHKRVYQLILFFLLLLTGFLFVQLYMEGNNVNCGCFGSLISLSPIESIFKNVVLIGVLFYVRQSEYTFKVQHKWIYSILILGFVSAVPYLLNPVGIANAQSTKYNEQIDLSNLPPLYQTNNKVNFTKGNKMLVFLSTSCSHCEVAAGRLSVLHKQQNINNIYYVIVGKKEERYAKFMENTRLESVPIIRFYDDEFFKYSGGTLPAIIYLEEGILKKRWTGDKFDMEELKTTLEN